MTIIATTEVVTAGLGVGSATAITGTDESVVPLTFIAAGNLFNGLVMSAPLGDYTNAATGMTTGRVAGLRGAGCTDARVFLTSDSLMDAGTLAARNIIYATWLTHLGHYVTDGFRVVACISPSVSSGPSGYTRQEIQVSPTKWAEYLSYLGEFCTLAAAQFSTAALAIEPFNESILDSTVDAAQAGPPDSRAWEVLGAQLHAAVRAAMPLHHICIQSGNGAQFNMIASLPVSIWDGNTSVLAHEYRNSSITHPRSILGISRLPWPLSGYSGGVTQALLDASAKLVELGYSGSGSEYTAAATELNFVFGNNEGPAKILSDWAVVAAFVDANDIPRYLVGVGETGMQGQADGVGQDLSVCAAYHASIKAMTDFYGFGWNIAHQAISDGFAFFEYTWDAGVFTWGNYLCEELATAKGWTGLATRYGANLGIADGATGWTADEHATLTTVMRSLKLVDDGAADPYHQAYRQPVASGASGKTYRIGFNVEAISGTSPQIALSGRQSVSGTDYKTIYVSAPGKFYLLAPATQSTLLTIMYANFRPDLVARISQITVQQVL